MGQRLFLITKKTDAIVDGADIVEFIPVSVVSELTDATKKVIDMLEENIDRLFSPASYKGEYSSIGTIIDAAVREQCPICVLAGENTFSLSASIEHGTVYYNRFSYYNTLTGVVTYSIDEVPFNEL